MPAVVNTIVNGTAKFSLGATKPPNWTTGTSDFSCQVTETELLPTANTVDVPATYCQGAASTAGLSSWELRLAGLQDLTESAGMSMFMFTNDAKVGWVQVVGPTVGTAASKLFTIEAPVTFLAANMLGAAGAPLTFEVTIPCSAKPTLTQSVAP